MIIKTYTTWKIICKSRRYAFSVIGQNKQQQPEKNALWLLRRQTSKYQQRFAANDMTATLCTMCIIIDCLYIYFSRRTIVCVRMKRLQRASNAQYKRCMWAQHSHFLYCNGCKCVTLNRMSGKETRKHTIDDKQFNDVTVVHRDHMKMALMASRWVRFLNGMIRMRQNRLYGQSTCYMETVDVLTSCARFKMMIARVYHYQWWAIATARLFSKCFEGIVAAITGNFEKWIHVLASHK